MKRAIEWEGFIEEMSEEGCGGDLIRIDSSELGLIGRRDRKKLYDGKWKVIGKAQSVGIE